MAIPKNIFQTFKSDDLPWLTKWHIKRLRSKNPAWKYHFYDDQAIQTFFANEMSEPYFKAYSSLTIGAAKADFFRYAVLHRFGGVYLDIDAKLNTPLDNFILEDDEGIISRERVKVFYTQWALIFNAGHPFLKRTLELCLENIQNHSYPHDVHKTTGPPVFTQAIEEVLKANPTVKYREMGTEYEAKIEDKYKLAKFFLYKNKNEHWNKKQRSQPIIITPEE